MLALRLGDGDEHCVLESDTTGLNVKGNLYQPLPKGGLIFFRSYQSLKEINRNGIFVYEHPEPKRPGDPVLTLQPDLSTYGSLHSWCPLCHTNTRCCLATVSPPLCTSDPFSLGGGMMSLPTQFLSGQQHKEVEKHWLVYLQD